MEEPPLLPVQVQLQLQQTVELLRVVGLPPLLVVVASVRREEGSGEESREAVMILVSLLAVDSSLDMAETEPVPEEVEEGLA